MSSGKTDTVAFAAVDAAGNVVAKVYIGQSWTDNWPSDVERIYAAYYQTDELDPKVRERLETLALGHVANTPEAPREWHVNTRSMPCWNRGNLTGWPERPACGPPVAVVEYGQPDSWGSLTELRRNAW